MSSLVFYIFNGVGLFITIGVVALIIHEAMELTGTERKGLLSFLKGFVLIGLSFLWTLFFGQLIMPSSFLTIQSVVLSLGMALLIYSANKLFEIYERTKNV